MKVLIWVLCLLGASVIQTVVRGMGIILGGLPTAALYLFTFWLAKTLSKSWENKHPSKKHQNEGDGE